LRAVLAPKCPAIRTLPFLRLPWTSEQFRFGAVRANDSKMDDPLSQALSEGPPPARLASFDGRPLGDTLDTFRQEILAVLNEHFFDAGVVTEDVPLLHAPLIDSGSVRISARRADPAYEAAVCVNIRCVRRDEHDVAHYEIEADGVLRRLRSGHPGEHAFPIEIVRAADGTRSVDTAALTRELAGAIRRFADEDHRG
jgi:hypothetical protein